MVRKMTETAMEKMKKKVRMTKTMMTKKKMKALKELVIKSVSGKEDYHGRKRLHLENYGNCL